MSKNPFFTVFSGTYNSSPFIERLFFSIKNQTCRDFEWIIIDDHSRDNTVDLLREFISGITDIDCRLIVHDDNIGIVKTRLEALDLAKGEVFVKWDHDDINKSNQLETFKQFWRNYDSINIGAIWCLCEDEFGNLVGNEYPSNEYVSNYFKLYSTHIVEGKKSRMERHNCVKVSVHKEALEYLVKNNIIDRPELYNTSALWASISLLDYNFLFINKVLRQYFIEPQRMSMTKSRRVTYAESSFRDRINWINYFMKKLPMRSIFTKLRIYLSLNVHGILAKRSIKEILSVINSPFDKSVALIFFLPALALVKIKKMDT